jgi:hypothetical protein
MITYLQTRLLNFSYSDLKKDASYAGFESDSLCYSPHQYKPYFDGETAAYCAINGNNYYSIQCQGWYRF